MTDAAVPVTQSVVEQFTHEYLQSLGCSIDKRGDLWDVSVPDDADTELSRGNLRIICGNIEDEGPDGEPLHPESSLCQQILTEAAERSPTGQISLTTENTEIELPEWLQNSAVDVRNTQFTPYYDRTAIVILFRASIETVSDYQTELLRAIGVDARSEERLPELEASVLQLTSVAENKLSSSPSNLRTTEVRPTVDTARDYLEEAIQETVDEIHQEASRAADSEVEEYRQMQQQRIQELDERQTRLSSKIEDLSETIDSSDQEKRIEALEQRKELTSEYDEVTAELTELRQQRDQGFPERQQEIRERHALEVRVTPLNVTEVNYERGEIELELVGGDLTTTETFGYGSGVGITEEVQCTTCNSTLSGDNPLGSISAQLQCANCSPAAGQK